jgi:hypothetical protein
MSGNNTLFVTAFYSNLGSSEMGGRLGRSYHYIGSLNTLHNLNQDFVIYTTEEEKKIIPTNKNTRLISYDLKTHPLHSYFQKKLNGYNTIDAHRCYEIMHGKILWIKNHINENYEYIYWIDCGLAHGGLFPFKYRGGAPDTMENHFKCSLMTHKVPTNLNKCNDKFTVLVGIQEFHMFERSINDIFFESENVIKKGNRHVIGGLFGGPTEKVKKFIDMYEDILHKMVQYDVLEREEQILTFLFEKNPEFFNPLYFTTWHHEDSDMAAYNTDNEIYFYNIFEYLNK